jgi:hypothetical protein
VHWDQVPVDGGRPRHVQDDQKVKVRVCGVCGVCDAQALPQCAVHKHRHSVAVCDALCVCGVCGIKKAPLGYAATEAAVGTRCVWPSLAT